MQALRIFGLARVKSRPDLAREKTGARALLTLVAYQLSPSAHTRTPSRELMLSLNAYGPVAETLIDQVDMGDRLFIEAHMEADHWTDAVSGRRRHGMSFVLDEFCVLERAPAAPSRNNEAVPRSNAQ